MFFIFIFFSYVSFCSTTGFKDDTAWIDWKMSYGKFYPSEESFRYANWLKNKEFVNTHNRNERKMYVASLNEFADLSDKEYHDIYLSGLKIPDEDISAKLSTTSHIPSKVDLPDEVNWVSQGYVTAMKTQGTHCASGYAFAATGALEGAWYKKTGKLVDMSVQQLLECTSSFGNEGCKGGWYQSCWEHIKASSGINADDEYRYVAQKAGKVGECRYDRRYPVARVKGYSEVKRGDEAAMKDALAHVGPIAVAVDASTIGFRFYRRGVFYDENCSSDKLNLALLAVGYGMEDGHDYWLVKNIWGNRWGSGGYIKMARNMSNNCGIASRASYPLV